MDVELEDRVHALDIAVERDEIDHRAERQGDGDHDKDEQPQRRVRTPPDDLAPGEERQQGERGNRERDDRDVVREEIAEEVGRGEPLEGDRQSLALRR